jgi:hypothetical protein
MTVKPAKAPDANLTKNCPGLPLYVTFVTPLFPFVNYLNRQVYALIAKLMIILDNLPKEFTEKYKECDDPKSSTAWPSNRSIK